MVWAAPNLFGVFIVKPYHSRKYTKTIPYTILFLEALLFSHHTPNKCCYHSIFYYDCDYICLMIIHLVCSDTSHTYLHRHLWPEALGPRKPKTYAKRLDEMDIEPPVPLKGFLWPNVLAHASKEKADGMMKRNMNRWHGKI